MFDMCFFVYFLNIDYLQQSRSAWLQIIMCSIKFSELLLNYSKHYHLIVTAGIAVLFATKVLVTLWHLHIT